MRATGRLGLGLAGLSSIQLIGCTALGWWIGHDVDKKAQPKPVPSLQVASLGRGQSVELVLRDGSVVAGRFEGMEPVPSAQYRERWQQGLQTLAPATLVPGLGAARLRKKAGSEGNVTLLGLRPGQLSFREAGNASNGTLSLESVAELGVPGGGSIDGVTLSRVAHEGRLPFLDAVAVKTKDGARQLVPLENVRSASARSGHGALTGALIGAAVDAVIVGVAIHEMNEMTFLGPTNCQTSDPTCTSCPTVYSDGTSGLRLDAEPIGGSLLAADEATDRAPLERLDARDGAYRLVIRNQMQETEHLDAVRLLVVDHAPGASVVPAMDGSLYVVHEALAPLRAVDATGANLAPLLSRQDGRAWTESPLGRDPDDPVSRRGSAVLEFERPRGAQSAVLDLSVQATDWGVALFGHVLALQGRELDAFWTRLETDAASRRVFRAAWAREALPRVEIDRGHGFRAAGTLAHIPLLVAGRRVVPLDLREVEGETLRVRIEALPGLWAFDRIGIDYDARPVTAARVLSPRTARTADGADAREQLSGSDDRRLTLVATTGRVDLAFDAPAPVPGAARSVLIEMEGYYRPLIAASGEPQAALFDRLVSEPGALARYALASVNAETRWVAALPPR